jgi:ATP-dependent Clp protease ATP-binding subunit ClpB
MDALRIHGRRRPDLHPKEEIPFTDETLLVLSRSLLMSKELGFGYVALEHLLLSFCRVWLGLGADILNNWGVNRKVLERDIIEELKFLAGPLENEIRDTDEEVYLGGLGTIMTEKAKSRAYDPVFGRDEEIDRSIVILSRKSKNNPVLLGEPGVGKTSLAEGLAQRIVNGDVPKFLAETSLISIDHSALLTNTKYRGQFEAKVKWLLDDAKFGTYIDEWTKERRVLKKPKELDENGNSKESKVYFFDEIHTIIGRVGNLLKPALSRGELVCMGATTTDEFAKYFEADAALTRRFQSVMIGEPSLEAARKILLGLRPHYEAYHNLFILDEAIDGAVNLSDEYIKYRNMPDKAIDVLDEACARMKLNLREYPTEILKMQKGLVKLNEKRREARVEIFRINSEKDLPKDVLDIDIELEWFDEVKLNLKTMVEVMSELVWTSAEKKQLITVHSKIFTIDDNLLTDLINESLAQLNITDVRLIKFVQEIFLQGDMRCFLHAQFYENLIEKQKDAKKKIYERFLEEETIINVQFNSILKEWNLNEDLSTDVNLEAVAKVISEWASAEIGDLSTGRINTVKGSGDGIRNRVVGQEIALMVVTRALRRARLGFTDPKRPIASIALLGPTGVGKTEIANSTALYFYGSEDFQYRLDMSEYYEPHSIKKLVGSAPGYRGWDEGGLLTNAVRKNPNSMVLFDEIEKAHGLVFDILLSILEDGVVADGQGRLVNFCKNLIIMTSNVGAELQANGKFRAQAFDTLPSEQARGREQAQMVAGRSKDERYKREFYKSFGSVMVDGQLVKRVWNSVYEKTVEWTTFKMGKMFRPEFINRLDSVVILRYLDRVDVRKVCEYKVLDQKKEMYNRKAIKFGADERLYINCGALGFDSEYGARPVKRVINKRAIEGINQFLLQGLIKEKNDCYLFGTSSPTKRECRFGRWQQNPNCEENSIKYDNNRVKFGGKFILIRHCDALNGRVKGSLKLPGSWSGRYCLW